MQTAPHTVLCLSCCDTSITKVTATVNGMRYQCIAMHDDRVVRLPPVLGQILSGTTGFDATNAYSKLGLEAGCLIGDRERNKIQWQQQAWPDETTLNKYAEVCPDIFTNNAVATLQSVASGSMSLPNRYCNARPSTTR